MPQDIRDALGLEAPQAIRRVMELSRMEELLENPKTAGLYLAANERVIVLTYGKDPVAVHLSGPEGEPLSPVDLSHFSDEELSTLARIQSQAEQRRLAASADAGGDSGGAEEEDAEEV